MKYQVLFSLKTMKKYSRLSSAAVVIGKSSPFAEIERCCGGVVRDLCYDAECSWFKSQVCY